MAITYVGGKGAGTAGQGGGSITLTTGLTGGSGGAPIAGDLVVVSVVVGSQARNPALAVVTPTGYTALTQQNIAATTYDTSHRVSYKVMGATPDTAVTIPASGNVADGIAYHITVFRGVDATAPLDVAATFATGSGVDNRPNPAAITPVTSGAWIVCCGGGAAATGTTLFTASYLTNFVSHNGADTNDGTVGSGYFTGWTSGAYDPAVWAGGSVNAANSWAATTLALRPSVNNYLLTAQGGSYTLAGGTATIKRDRALTASGGSYAYAGQQATITYALAAAAYTLTAQGGSYAITGASASLNRNRRLTSSGGTYAITGQSVTLLKSRRIVSTGGTYAIAGQQATLRKTKLVTALGGAYTYTGATAILERDRKLTASGGSYVLSGQQATVTYTPVAAAYTITAQGGTYAITGQSATIERDRLLTATGGSYALTGQQATVTYTPSAVNYTLTAQGGAYTLTGQAATLVKTKRVTAQGGAYAYTGQNAVLTKEATYTISATRANLIYELALLHGLVPGNPLTVSATQRAAGALSQTITGTTTVTITKTSSDILQGSINDWIDALAAIHGLTTPLVTTDITRVAGTLSQTLVTDGTTTTVTLI